MEILETIINISEGRNTDNVEYVVDSVRQTPGCFLLDYSSDEDHNRTVITFIGNRKSLLEAIKELYKRTLEKINLKTHQGEHPRLGAVDVVPFVPIREITVEEAVEFSKQVAAMIWETYKVPVYLYEDSQKNPERKNLANIRKGQFEGLEEKMKKAEWKPDYGECAPHPTAGASVVGARMPLIAFNVNLGTSDINIANTISKNIRGSSGGMAFVKAMGVELKERGIVQISMNMVNYKKSPLFRVFELIKSEAQRYGVPVVGSEIIGLLPQDALFETAEYYLRCENYSSACILENKIQESIEASDKK
ncbi:MAG: glutamate formimidoyltransferase [Candidatus Riflebacteria bacterium]|nr:glutamate formimidoyltransferase [Candidatus Riflebacteria bacterium]